MTQLALSPWHIWLIIAVLLLTAEIFVPGFVLAGLGFAAVCAAVAHYFSDDLGWALLAYSIGAITFFIAIRPIAVKTFLSAEQSPFGIHGMIGKRVIVSDSPDLGGKFQTTFRDTQWSVESEDDLMEGDSATIIAVKSTTLVVQRISPLGE